MQGSGGGGGGGHMGHGQCSKGHETQREGGKGGGNNLHLVTEQEGKEGLVLVDWKDFSEEISKI